MEIWKKKITWTAWFSVWKLKLIFCGGGCAGQFFVSVVCMQDLSIIAVGICVRAMLLGANCFLTHCQLPLGKHFRGGPLVTAQQWGAEWLQAVNSCGIWEHLTPPEEHPAPWRIKPRILTWIHTNHVQPLSWLMITEMANNHIAFSWLPKDKPAWHLWPPCSSLLPVSCSHCLV